jgi:hypothetical protein
MCVVILEVVLDLLQNKQEVHVGVRAAVVPNPTS